MVERGRAQSGGSTYCAPVSCVSVAAVLCLCRRTLPLSLSLSLFTALSVSLASVSVAKTKSTPAKKGNVFGAQIQRQLQQRRQQRLRRRRQRHLASIHLDKNVCRAGNREYGNGNGQWDWQWVLAVEGSRVEQRELVESREE